MITPENREVHIDGSGSFVTPMLEERVGVQERASEFGAGDTKRVYEIVYGDYSFGVNLGDITQAPTDAVMLPSTPWLQIGGGAIENAIYSKMGAEYDDYTDRVRNFLERISESTSDSEMAEWGDKLSQLFTTVGKTSKEDADLIAARLGNVASMIELPSISGNVITLSLDSNGKLQRVPLSVNLGLAKDSLELPYGEAIPCIPGKLASKGIKSVIISNVLPSHSNSGQESGMTGDHMVMFAHNAAQVADKTGAKSITVPAIGTGFAAAFGFGMSMQDSITGFFLGAKEFADSGETQDLRSLDFNIYARAEEDTAREVAELIRSQGIPELLAL